MRHRIQPSVMVVADDNQTQIKTHPSARKQASIDALKEMYDTIPDLLPPEVIVSPGTLKDARFAYN